jgi:hypothetical protein
LRDSKVWGPPLAVFLIALVIRLIGIGWGLPNDHHRQSYHPDEPVIWAYSQGIEPTKLKFTPGFYNYGTLYLTTLRVASDVVAGYTGGGLDPKSPEKAWDYIGKSHLAGRILSVLAGAGTALVVFLLLRRFTTDFGAFLGGFALAIAPGHVVHSRFQTVDVLATFLLALSAFYACRLSPGELDSKDNSSQWKLAALCGLFAGLSAGTKYTGILVLLVPFFILIAARRKDAAKLGSIAIGVALGAFLISTPGFLLENAKFMEGFLYETRHVKEGHGLVFEGTSSGYFYHIGNLFLGIGPIVTLLGFGALIAATTKRMWWAGALLLFFAVYYLLIAGAEVKFIRYTFPLYVPLTVGFGWLMGQCREWGGKWHLVVGVGLLGLGGLFGGGLISTARFTSWMAARDPRDSAGAFLAGKNTSVGLVEDPWFYTPAIHPDLGRRLVYEAGMPQVGIAGYPFFDPLVREMTSPSIVRFVPAEGVDSRLDWDIRLITEAKPEYVVYSSFEYENFARISQLANPSPVGKATVERAEQFRDRLLVDYDFVQMYGPGLEMVHDMMYVQPTVWLWKRKPGR